MRLANYDINEIGSVTFKLDFDEDDYNEYLEDNGLTDSNDSKFEFVRDNCTYDAEFTDSQLPLN